MKTKKPAEHPRHYPSLSDMDPGHHSRVVKEIFSSITGRYDFLNHLLSLRRDIAWRRATVRRMQFFSTRRLLDVATGTADLAIDAALRYPAISVDGIDLVQAMMDVGQQKIAQRGLARRITLQQADALHLPFPDESFDVAAIAFGIRNIPDRLGALREMKRVVIPGGRVIVLEMSLPDEGVPWRGLLALYLKKLMPAMAALFSSHSEAYTYLADSISHFPGPRQFAVMMQEAGLQVLEQKTFFPGITVLHVGIKESL